LRLRWGCWLVADGRTGMWVSKASGSYGTGRSRHISAFGTGRDVPLMQMRGRAKKGGVAMVATRLPGVLVDEPHQFSCPPCPAAHICRTAFQSPARWRRIQSYHRIQACPRPLCLRKSWPEPLLSFVIFTYCFACRVPMLCTFYCFYDERP
jgi:hypothetical protein